jgi:Fe-S-cluster containining protein
MLRVAVTHHDLRRLVAGLGRPAASFVEWLDPEQVDMTGEPGSFVELEAGRRLMVLAHRGGGCHLLEPTFRCGAYASRPLDCRVYPFDLVRSEDRRLVELGRLDAHGCGDRGDPPEDLGRLSSLDDQRWQELRDYQARLERWNRLARHRRRFQRRVGDAGEFLAWLGLDETLRAPAPPAAP